MAFEPEETMEDHLGAAPAAHLTHLRSLVALPLTLLASACAWQTYEANPLPENLLGTAAAERDELEVTASEEEAKGVTLHLAALWLRERGPEVRRAVAAYRTAASKAEIDTPWPNPTIAAGPDYGYGSGVTINEIVPTAGVGFRLPLSDRLGCQDMVNEAVALDALAAAVTRFRELYLDLRLRYTSLLITQQREQARRDVLAAAGESLEIADELVAAGVATALDLSLFRLEYARERSRCYGIQIEVADAEAGLADLVAVSPLRLGELPADELPVAPDEVPSIEELRELAQREHPELARLRAAYEVAESRLRLEVELQYPDLEIGASFAGETGEKKRILGLSLGIELPIFDRNQQGIAEARGRREEIRIRYEGAAQRVLTAIDRAYATVELATARHRILRDEVLPAAIDNVEIARVSLAAGSAGALQVLDAERSLRQVQLEVLEAQMARLEAWAALERAVGWPLMKFPSEGGSEAVPPPAIAGDRDEDRDRGEE